MKWFIGFFVLLVTLVMISGCTQPSTTPATATTIPTTVTTTVQTPVPTTASATATTPVATTVPTTVATTVVATPTTTSNSTLVIVKTPTVAAANMVTTIHITSAGFNPQLDVVLPGTAISWVNDDLVPHAVKATGTHDGLFTSDSIQPNSQFKYDFGKEGTFEYALVDLPNVKGTIIVKSGGGMTSYST